jgi:hypothetical protein
MISSVPFPASGVIARDNQHQRIYRVRIALSFTGRSDMVQHKKPGPTGHSKTHHSIKDGTSVKTNTAPPGILSLERMIEQALEWYQWQIARLAIQRLFDACLNPETSISDPAWLKAAQDLNVDVESVKAVAQVESKKSPFDEEGHPTILFERHYFHRLTHGAYDKKHPKISSATAGGYGKFREQYGKLQEAYLLDPSAALESASWGKFQIMGANYKQAGFLHVEEMVASMMISEQNQLDAFVKFVGSDKAMKKALKDKDWAVFARRYNGPGYKKNDYDVNLKAAYDAEKKKSAATPPASPHP